MPRRCVPCLSPDIREAILREVSDPALRETLEQLPDCGRKRSAYQEFVSTCMKAKHLTGLDPEAMRNCARQWRERTR